MKDGIISLIIAFGVDYYLTPFILIFKSTWQERGMDAISIERNVLIFHFAAILSVTVLVYFIILLVKCIFLDKHDYY
ncbi:hypothetical protein EDD76_1181 [Kineothrix alysoides]|uniref:Uncharacterized protein n=1 Tax=Kineothrix alysoides TaxID=1469948 RepID=A0A4R1QWK6_9FIRM|nr:hypothetical protein [Kineothrix alysoides]TCL54760.1 hypothetical protein EDD76_1181 [Kineothrix alysoides]